MKMGVAPMDRQQRWILGSMILIGTMLTMLTFSKYVDESRFTAKFDSLVERAGALAVGSTEVTPRF
jgi:hypothetical protein